MAGRAEHALLQHLSFSEPRDAGVTGFMHYIFEVRAKPGYSIDEYAKGWVAVSEYIQQAPGAMGTRLHRKIGEEEVALAIASWESKAHRDGMSASPPEEIAALLEAQKPFIEVRFIGEFEFPEWVVLPEHLQQSDEDCRLPPDAPFSSQSNEPRGRRT